MSDSVKDLVKHYNEKVLSGNCPEYPRSIGLFLIPEYPEDEVDRGMWSSALEAILTTLRYLAPATLLTLFWGQQSFLFKLLKHIDSAFRAIVFSSEEQKQAVLQWLAEAGPVQIEHLDTVWRHGWILCGVLDAAMPGACAGHPPTRLSLKHAQAIADHYLGVEPVFTRQELETSDSLSKHQEWRLATYLDRIREALTKITPPVSKPTSLRTSPESTQFTLDYVAKGSGLTAAQVRNKMYFKIYPTSQQCLDPGEVTILVRGPKDTYGMSVIPPILGKAQMIRQKLLGLQSKLNYTETALPLTQGATYMRSYGKNDMNKTYHIPKAKYDIEIEVDMRTDHAKIGYTVRLPGKYEISITSKGQNIVGSPFAMTASKNIIGILENDSFNLEDGEEIDIVDVKTDRKVVLRIVDFVTEKMLLKENGSLEKITDAEAKTLMFSESSRDISSVNTRLLTSNVTTTSDVDIIKVECNKFNTLANKVVTMNRISKMFQDIIAEKKLASEKDQKAHIKPRTQQTIPDIVNSTFGDSKSNLFLKDKRDKFIIPENISVSLRMEKPTSHYEEVVNPIITEVNNTELKTIQETESDSDDSLEEYVTIEEQIENMDRAKSSSNPFLNDMYEQNYVLEKDLGTFVKTEYETNNSQNEETENTSIKIIVDPIESETPYPLNTNPFIEPDVINLERPKTPVLKIITGEVKNREDSVYVDPKAELIAEDLMGNEFLNPFFIHHHQTPQQVERLPITDFIIGAPVSLPPIIRAPTPEPDMEAMLMTGSNKNTDEYGTKQNEKQHDSSSNYVSPSVFSTPLHTNLTKIGESHKLDNTSSLISSTFQSLDSNLTDSVEILSLSNASDNQNELYQESSRLERDVTPKKDIWDSAYVSIDDSNSSPDSNNNDNTPLCELHSKQKFSPSDNNMEFSKMGPAEREIWQMELQDEPKVYEDVKPNKWEVKRQIFTPIIEESDRSITAVMKDVKKTELAIKNTENDPVTVAFAELNDVYQEYFPNSECSYTAQHIERNDCVDSASAIADVKRHEKNLEGKISEVQTNVTESVSVSQTLHDKTEQPNKITVQNDDEIQFGESKHNNIVLERKQYWDEKIRQIEANTEENKTLQKKRRLSSKQLRHNDSLTKRRGKQIVKKYLSVGQQQDTTDTKQISIKEIEIVNKKGKNSPVEQVQTDTKIVEKWKTFWNNKMEIEKDETDTTCFRAKSPKKPEQRISPHLKQNKEMLSKANSHIDLDEISSRPVKQELPEEVFKAFETSPKRFFGTSRKQILNKIDTFLGKPSTADESSTDVGGASNHETGLVSSRISLFHNISQTEDIPLGRRKCQSMHNIFQRKDSEKSITFEDKAILNKPFKIVEGKKYDNDNISDAKDVETDKFASMETKPVTISLKDKRARMVQKMNNKTFDEAVYKKTVLEQNKKEQKMKNKTFDEAVYKKPVLEQDKKETIVRKAVNDLNKQKVNDLNKQKYKPSYVLRKSSMSKSEMDIFNKTTSKPEDDDLDKYKSCEELPKINVKNFISLYESVSKTDVKCKPVRKISTTNNGNLQKHSSFSSTSGAVNINTSHIPSQSSLVQNKEHRTSVSESNSKLTQSPIYWKNESQDSRSSSLEPKSLDSIDIEIISAEDLPKESTYLSLSDIELEIIESPVSSAQSTPEKEATNAHTDYKSRFKLAKQFFQSLEELTDEKKPAKLNECEILLLNKSNESLENDRPKKRTKKNIKSHSMPSSEISKIWTQLQESQEASSSQLVKISEKFNVEDLFNDVVEGRLSRQGSLRGIPHKKAVLEAFRSMENLADSKLSSYEIAVSQLNDFAKENKIKNAQTYLTEYPYLPTTDPSKYHSRLDAKATGLISLKELLNQKPRRNSVPDLRLNTRFTVDL